MGDSSVKGGYVGKMKMYLVWLGGLWLRSFWLGSLWLRGLWLRGLWLWGWVSWLWGRLVGGAWLVDWRSWLRVHSSGRWVRVWVWSRWSRLGWHGLGRLAVSGSGRLGWVGNDGGAVLLVSGTSECVVGNLKGSWASNSVVVSGELVVLGEDEVCLAGGDGAWHEVGDTNGWDSDGVAVARDRELGLGVATGSDKVRSLRIDAGGDLEGQDLTSSLGAGWGDGDGWESHEALEDLERASGASWAASDEWCSQREDLVEVQGDVEWRRERRQSWGLVLAQVGGVTGLHRQDRSCGSEVVGALDELGSTQVCTDTNALEDIGNSQERGHISEAEVVCALRNGSGTSGSQTSSEEVDVSLLIELDLLQVVQEGCLESSGLEVGQGELGDGLAVEGVLQVLEGQSILEDGGTEKMDISNTLSLSHPL